MRTVKRIIPFIIVLAVLSSVLTMIISAANTSTTRLATVIYKLDTDDNYYIEGNSFIATSTTIGYYTYGSTDYLMNYLNSSSNALTLVLYQAENNRYKLLKANSSSTTYTQLTIDSTLDLKVIYRCYNGLFRYGYNKTNVTINPDDYTGVAKAFAYAYANRVGSSTSTKYATDMFAVCNSSTQIVNQSIVTGVIGDVYQGIISEDGYIHATNSRYNYSLVNGSLQVSFGIQSNLSGIDYNERGLFLHYQLLDQEITIPTDGNNQSYTYDFGSVNVYNNSSSNNAISFFFFFNGTQYADLSDPLHAFVTAILLQAFDVVEFNDSQFIWATRATIEQDLQLSIYNGELVIIDQLGKIVSFIEDSTTVDLSEPGFEDVFGMIETQDFLDAKAMIDEVDLSSHIAGVSFIINTASYAFINPVISTVLLSILFAFSVAIMVIKGLRR